MPYPTFRVLSNPLLLAMLTFQAGSIILEVHTYAALNTPETSRMLTVPYPTIRVLSNLLLLATLTFQVGSTTLEFHT